MSLDSKVLLTSEKPFFDVSDKLVAQGSYVFQVLGYDNGDIIGKIVDGQYAGKYRFKQFTVIKLMGKAQSFLSRRSGLTALVTQYPSPTHTPLSKKTIGSPKTAHTVEAVDECGICLEDCQERTTCGHIFHPRCITKWRKSSNTCPACRQESPKMIPRKGNREKGTRCCVRWKNNF